MAGRLRVTPNDANAFRTEYLNTLALQSKINDLNLQANLLYKKTGMTPTQPTDTRLTIEKMADVEGLKQQVRSGLKDIADGQQSQAIVQELTPEELVFVSQHMPQIILEIRPKYRYGILAPIFLKYLQTLMAKDTTMLALDNRIPVAAPPPDIVAAVGVHDRIDQVAALHESTQELLNALDIKRENLRLYPNQSRGDPNATADEVEDSIDSLQKRISIIHDALPPIEVFTKIENLPITEKYNAYDLLNKYFRYAPNPADMIVVAKFIMDHADDPAVGYVEWCNKLDNYNMTELPTFLSEIPDLLKLTTQYGAVRHHVAPVENFEKLIGVRNTAGAAATMFTPNERVEKFLHKGLTHVPTEEEHEALVRSLRTRQFTDQMQSVQQQLVNSYHGSDEYVRGRDKMGVFDNVREEIKLIGRYFGGELTVENFRPTGVKTKWSMKIAKKDMISTLRNMHKFLEPVYRSYDVYGPTIGDKGL